MDMLRIKEVSDYTEFAGYKTQWRDLCFRSRLNNIFLTFDWIDLYVRHFCKNKRLLILTVYDKDVLVGIAPLMIKRHRYHGLDSRCLCFIGTDIFDRTDFIVDGDKEKIIMSMLDYLIKISNRWNYIDLQEISEDTGTLDIIRDWLVQRGIVNLLESQEKSFYMQLNGDRNSLLEKFERRFEQKMRKIKNRGSDLNLQFKRYTNGEIDEDLLSSISLIMKHSWKGRRRKSIFSGKVTGNFHREMLKKSSNNKWLDLSVLSVDGKPIAFIYNYLYSQRLSNYSMEFDDRYSHISPGTILMYWILKDPSSRDVLEFDFGKGEEAWKERFTKKFRMHNRIRIFKDDSCSKILYLQHLLYLKIKPCLKRNKALYRGLTRIKDVLQCY